MTHQRGLSAELEALLADADARLGMELDGPGGPTPDEEVEGVLPASLLAVLDEPLEDEEDNEALARTSGEDVLVLESTAPRAVTQAGTGRVPRASSPMSVPPTVPPGTRPRKEARVPAPEGSAGERAASTTAHVGILSPAETARHLGNAISARASGCLTVESADALRRVVVRDGDIVAAASSAEDESLMAFLVSRGDLTPAQVRSHVGRIAPFGAHAGAALVGHGLLRQDQLWPTLRAHAEWLVGRALLVSRGSLRFDAEAPGRLAHEPPVFGGSSGAEVLIETLRRFVRPEDALLRLGGRTAVIAEGPNGLLAECALDVAERRLIEHARGHTLDELGRHGSEGLATLVYGLSVLGVVVVEAASSRPVTEAPSSDRAMQALDGEAVRERVQARLELVAEADYFALLGVSRDATGYEIRRAFLELRRAFEPATIAALAPGLHGIDSDLQTILGVLEEAYEILRDATRRERYRRALGDA